MIRNIAAAAALLVLSVVANPASAQTVLDNTQIGHEESYSRLITFLYDRLADPFSVVMRRLVFYPNQVVCGELNAKNRFGGYLGFTNFIYDPNAVLPARRFWTEADEGAFLVSQRCNGAAG